jgi:hypothetical protein
MLAWIKRQDNMLPEMRDKGVNIESVAEKALQDEKLLSELLDGLTSKEETFRYNCFKVLMLISQEFGTALYPKWDYFVELIASDNTYWKMSGLQIIANLTKVDTDNKFDKIFDLFYSLLGDKGTILPAHVAANSGKIAKAKPYLQDKITDKLLNIDKVYLGKQIALINGYAIEAFGEYFAEARNQDRIIEFVRNQLNSDSPRTRKQAENFLSKWA